MDTIGTATICFSKILNLQKENRKTFVPVGGLSRSGKSTFISFIQDRLKEQLISSISIPLDYWILPVEKRLQTMTVKDRYQYQKLSDDLLNLIDHEEISIVPYESLTRSISKDNVRISIKDTQVIFFDGVIALDLPFINQISAMRIYIEVDEEIRRKRFIEFYQTKKINEAAIRLLYEKRMQDETDLIIASSKKADFIINLSPG